MLPLKIFKVTGNSMLPTLAAGDFVIASRLFFKLRVGDHIVANHPDYDCIVKKIQKIDPTQGYWLSGENSDSVTPEQIGWLNRNQIIAKVILKIKKKP